MLSLIAGAVSAVRRARRYHPHADKISVDKKAVCGGDSQRLPVDETPWVKPLPPPGYAIQELEETAKAFLLLRGSKTRLRTREQVAELTARFSS